MPSPKNIVGPTVRRLRNDAGLSQPQLAAKCGVIGWDLSREVLAQIGSQFRYVTGRVSWWCQRSISLPMADCTRRGKSRVMCVVCFPGEFDLTRERQIIADEDAGPGGDAGREGLVVRIAQAEDPVWVLLVTI
jgi:hypothetical protein